MDVRVYAMGCGHDHRLGVGRGEANKERPTAVSFFTENQLMVRDVYAGGAHSMVLTDKGLYAFGYNDEGQLGVGTFGICMKPTLIPLFKTEDIKGVSLGGYHSMVYTHSGGTFSFGANGNGQLGNGADDNAKNPTEIKLEGAVRDVSAGAQHTLAWTESGVYSWGLGDNGQLGYAGDAFDEMISKQNRIKAQIAHDAHINTMGGQRNATHYPDPDARVSEVGGYNPRHHPDAKKHDTRVFFAAFCQRTPKKIPFFETGEEVRSVHAGYNTSSVLTTNGIYVFGARPGVVREMLSDTVPTLVALPAEGMVFRQFLALKDLRVGLCEAADGTLSVWKSTEEELSWTPVIDDTPPDTRVHGTELSIYVSHSDGLSAFGDNFFGQLGYPTDVTQPDFTPPRAVDLPTLETTSPLFTPKVYKVAAGWHHALICVGEMVGASPYPENVEEKVISVLTVNEIRYQGVIHVIEIEANSVTLRDVTIFGTEDRVVDNKIPAQPNKFEFVVLGGDNIKEIILYEYIPADSLEDREGSSAMDTTSISPSSGPPNSYLDAVRGKQAAAAAAAVPVAQNRAESRGDHGHGGYKGTFDHPGGKGGKGYRGQKKGGNTRYHGEYNTRRP